ncbi:hypothetical protein [Pedobacter suwonensis]|uniref:hypothetical protein n=1 Tax=Pedobacter suwonensis TaxID=332999 RepID=UPI00367DBD49
MNKFKIITLISSLLLANFSTYAQKRISPALKEDNLEAINRKFSIKNDPTRSPIIYVEANPNPGILWIKGLDFELGSIEFDVKGKDVLQESFVGIAFHGQNDTTYQSIYFRPFNFRTTDPVRRKHAVQYMSLPKSDWPILREKFPDRYEAPMNSSINPEDWFHVRVEIFAEIITVFINGSNSEIFKSKPLTSPKVGKVGFWTGNGSDGWFTNLKIIHHQQATKN